jgi:hypothetical protein
MKMCNSFGSNLRSLLNFHIIIMVTRDHAPYNRNLRPLIIYECSIYKVIDRLF